MHKLCFFILIVFLTLACSKDSETGTSNDGLPPTFRVLDAEIRETEGTQSLAFEIEILNPNGNPVTFDMRTVDGSAVAGTDYNALSTTSLSISGTSGATAESITQSIEILGDLEEEPSEQFTIEFYNIVNANTTSTSVSVTIINDDAFDQTAGVLTVEPTIPSSGATSPTSYNDMSLVWSEEFTGDGINGLDWTFEIGDGCPNVCGWGNNELEYYTDKNAVIRDDNYLVIEARNETISGKNYTSTRMISKDKVEFKYGRIDIRAVLPKGQGLWPAIWMLGANIDDAGWPACGEIDIMELVGHKPGESHSTVHYGSNFDNRRYNGNNFNLSQGQDFSEAFHIFSLDWKENSLEFYVDDTRIFSFARGSIQNNQPYPFNEDFFMILNIAVGGNWPGNPDQTTSFPQHMIVDYIRVFQ